MNIALNQNLYSKLSKTYKNSPSFKADLRFETPEARDLLEKDMECINPDKTANSNLVSTILKYFKPVTKMFFDGTVLLVADEDEKLPRIKYLASGGKELFDTGQYLSGYDLLHDNNSEPHIDLKGKTPLNGIDRILGYLWWNSTINNDKKAEIDKLRYISGNYAINSLNCRHDDKCRSFMDCLCAEITGYSSFYHHKITPKKQEYDDEKEKNAEFYGKIRKVNSNKTGYEFYRAYEKELC